MSSKATMMAFKATMMAFKPSFREVIPILQVASPAFLLLAILFLLPIKPSPALSYSSPITSVVVASRIPRRGLIVSLLCIAAAAYFADGVAFAIFTVLSKSWSQPVIGLASVIGIISYAGLAGFGVWKEANDVKIWTRKRVKYAITASLLAEIAVVTLIGICLTKHGLPQDSLHYIFFIVHYAIASLRVLLLLALLPSLLFPRTVYLPVNQDEEADTGQTDTSLLLPPANGLASRGLSPVSAADQSKYGTFPENNQGASNPPTTSHTPVLSIGRGEAPKPPEELDPTWREMFHRLRRIAPHMWPSKSLRLQLLALLCVILLFVGRFLNAAVPVAFGKVVEILETKQGSPWIFLAIYIALRYLQSMGGLRSLIRILWLPVMQYSEREMTQLAFDHILRLSFSWHLRRKTGEVLRTLDRGSAINTALELLVFAIVPNIIDTAIAVGVFTWLFEPALALVTLVAIVAYVYTTIKITSWWTKVRRRMRDFDIVTRTIHTDCLLNYETVKYFNGETHEGERYAKALKDYQAEAYKYYLSTEWLQLIQNFIFTLGFLIGCIIVAHRVVQGLSKPSDFVIFVTYFVQLYAPLLSLGSIYRSINATLIDSERLLNLLNEPTEVNDAPGAFDLVVQDGTIEFDNVSFSYDGRTPALSGVSFKVPKGSGVALVGESGSGKSTILRLLYRFYDLKEGQGRILIDGKDIRDVTQTSLRKAIGVVPQDSILFNASIEYNIGYGRPDASPTEIQLAAQAAQMHNRIMGFPDGYETKVGERGVRLSGGEKQRVAIARTMLKNPPILLLDEATSALDTSTEKDIQKALQNLVEGRSSLSIAHRLSTIVDTDLILVLKDGRIIEQGTHRELIALDGVFAAMWAAQIMSSQDAPLDGGEDGIASGAAHKGEPSAVSAEAAGASVTHATGKDASLGDLSRDASDTVVPEPMTFPASDSAAPSVPSTSASPSQSLPAQTVMFGSGVTTPSRSGTPDPDSEGKRKRSPAQNLQRLARRISLTTRKEGSGVSLPRIPGFGKKEGSRDESSSLRGEASASGGNNQ